VISGLIIYIFNFILRKAKSYVSELVRMNNRRCKQNVLCSKQNVKLDFLSGENFMFIHRDFTMTQFMAESTRFNNDS